MIGSIIDAMASRVTSPVLIGRADELARLRGALGAAIEGRSTTILIGGEAGVGKTRVVSEFAERAEAEGAVVLAGGCIPLGDGALPYAPVIEALRGLVRRTPVDELEEILGPRRSELGRLIPALEPLEARSSSGLGIESAQGRLFELLLGVLERLAAHAPVAFIVEDLHWSDRSTRDLLGFLVRNLRDSRVALVATYRSDELHRRHPLLPFLAELTRTGRVDRLQLEPLDRTESAAQLRAIGGDDLDAALIQSIHARSGGNPFFAEELLVAAGPDGRSALPPTLRDVLLARIAGLSGPTQEFLRIASAAGQRVNPALIAAASGTDEASLVEALRESVGRHVLLPDPTASAERYTFRHALLQEAIYDDLLPGERMRLHVAFARTLETWPPGMWSQAAAIAYHWFAGHDLPNALGAAVRAGEEAEAEYAYAEAVSQYERAIELWDQVPDAEARARRDRIDVLTALAGAARFHDPARSVAHVQTAISLVDQGQDPVRVGLLHERLGRYALGAGQGELSKAAYQTAMRLVPAEPPSEARARAVAGFAQTLMLGGRFEESLALANDARLIARAVGARDIEGHAVNTRGVDRAVGGDVEGGLEDLRLALAMAEEAGVVDDIGRAHANRVMVLDLADRLEEAIDAAGLGVASAEHLGSLRFWGAHLLCNAADALYRLGRWDESERAMRRAEEMNPLGINAILVQELLARLAVARGRFGEAADRLRPVAPLAERAGDIQFVRPVQASLAELALWQGRPADAMARVAEAIPRIDISPEVRVAEVHALGIRASADAAELARARRSSADERAAVEAGDTLLRGIRRRHSDGAAHRPAFVGISAAYVALCEAESTRLHRAADPAAWAACGRAWSAQPYVAAYAGWRQAEALLESKGDRGEAETALRSALEVARRLGAEPLLREVNSLAVRARLTLDLDEGPPAGPVPGDGERLGLTRRELEVLELLALGRTNRQIADELFISANTAGAHVSHILGKLDVASRGEAAALGYRLGLVGARRPEETAG